MLLAQAGKTFDPEQLTLLTKMAQNDTLSRDTVVNLVKQFTPQQVTELLTSKRDYLKLMNFLQSKGYSPPWGVLPELLGAASSSPSHSSTRSPVSSGSLRSLNLSGLSDLSSSKRLRSPSVSPSSKSSFGSSLRSFATGSDD